MPRSYTLIDSQRRQYVNDLPGTYAGWRQGRIFGRLDCKSGARKIAPGNRVFFADLETAVRAGYRPCQACAPMTEKEFEDLKRHLPPEILPEPTLEAFSRRPRRVLQKIRANEYRAADDDEQ